MKARGSRITEVEPITALWAPDRQPSGVFRRGDSILGPVGFWTPAVAAPLNLERVGPRSWSDDAISQAGRLLWTLPDATAGFRPPPDAAWYRMAVPPRLRRARERHQPLKSGTVAFRDPRRAAVRAHRRGYRTIPRTRWKR